MSSPKRQLRVLIVEDSENDAALLRIELERAGYLPACRRVETAAQLQHALEQQAWQVVIADYVMPQFNGLAALDTVKRMGLDIPFIIVSGHITDDTAVAAMKAGAHDYVMKDNLARLGPAVDRELREAEVRRQRRRSEEKLKVESAFRQAVENSVPSGITAVDLDGRQTYVNPAFCSMVGWSEAELVGARPPFVYWPPEDHNGIEEALARIVRDDVPAGGLELRFRRRNSERLDVLLQMTPLKDAFGNVTGWVSAVSDISQRKRAEIRLAAEHAITRILANATSLDEAAPGIIQVLLDSLEVDVGTLWLLDPKHHVLHPSWTNVRTSTLELKTFMEESRRLSFHRGESLPGRVWQEGKPQWVSDIGGDPHLARRGLAAESGLYGAMAFPIQRGEEFFGVLEFFNLRPLDPDPTVVNMIVAIASEIGQFVQRRGAEEALRRAHDELEARVQQRTADLKLANTRLAASIAERKRLEHELLDITEKERRRIGLDLHDDLGQKLSGIALMTKGLELRLAKTRGAADAALEAAKIHALVQEAMSHASDLAHDLATLDVSETDLASALASLADHVQGLFGTTCRFKGNGNVPPLPAEAVKQLYKIAQEAVTNAIKHGKAKRVTVSLGSEEGRIVMRIQNTGLPFPDLTGRSTGMGLRIMNYRANLVGGTLEIKGTGMNGTVVTCTLPVPEAAQAGSASKS